MIGEFQWILELLDKQIDTLVRNKNKTKYDVWKEVDNELYELNKELVICLEEVRKLRRKTRYNKWLFEKRKRSQKNGDGKNGLEDRDERFDPEVE
jgi:hypothetical protein